MTLDPNDYRVLAQLLEAKCGIEVEAGKDYLFESRLAPLAQSLGLAGIPALVAAARQCSDGKICKQIVEAMTTHESLFFRDGTPFQVLAKQLVPELVAAKDAGRPLRIWSAACSSGQEPYSIAMTLLGILEFQCGRPFDILATDVSSCVLKKAREGVYSDFEVRRGCSPEILRDHFTQEGAGWRVKDAVKRSIRFEEGNLLEPLPGEPAFDIIFCRNVLIYFNPMTKIKVLRQIAEKLCDRGFLLLGGTESVYGLSNEFERIDGESSGIYRKVGSRQRG